MDFQSWLSAQTKISPKLLETLEILADYSIALAERISLGELSEGLGQEVGENIGGDTQKALDVIADEGFMAALANSPVRWYASEERDEVEEASPEGSLALTIDPLDGSSNIDVNLSIGTIFGIYDARDDRNASVLRAGRELQASGYFLYGPQTSFVFTLGDGVHVFTLDRVHGKYLKTDRVPKIPAVANEYAINASNYRHWPKPIRKFIDDCNIGVHGPREKDWNMRWVASLVAETQRILMRGGIFLYPGDRRPGYAKGRLRMVYECAPIAFLVEQAGGQATDGQERILDIVPEDLHARTPFVFGSSAKVMRVAAYSDWKEGRVSPLFTSRGLLQD